MMNKELIAKRLEILREEMRREHLSAFVFTTETLIIANILRNIGKDANGLVDSMVLRVLRWSH